MTAAAVDLISQAQAVCRQRIADAKKATPGPWRANSTTDDKHTGTGNDIGGNIRTAPGGPRGAFVGRCWGWGPTKANATHIANHSPDKVVGLWEWAYEQLGEYDEEARWTPDGMDRNNRAVSLATAIVGSHE